MIVFKLWYLFYFSASSCLYPYFNIVFRRFNHLTEQQIATIAFIRPFISLPAGALFSSISDKWRIHRSILIFTFISASICRVSVIYITSTFTTVLITMLIADSFTAPVTILVDAATIAACTLHKQEYARHRLYGAIGWGTFSLIAGSCMHYFGLHSIFLLAGVLSLITLLPTFQIDWTPLHATFMNNNTNGINITERRGSDDDGSDNNNNDDNESAVLLLMNDNHQSLKHKHHHNTHNTNTKHHTTINTTTNTININPSFLSRLTTSLLSNPHAILFFTMVTIMGCAVGTIEGFLFLFLDDLGGSETLMGLTLTITCIAETLVFYYAKTIIDYFGLDGCFHICFLAFLIRLGSYASLSWWPSPWLVLPVELLHGVTFGLTWAAGTAKSALLASPGLEATTQSIFQGCMFGIGTGVGGLIAGNMYYEYGAQLMFSVMFMLVLCGWIGTSIARYACCGGKSGGGNGGRGVELVHV